MDMKAVKEVIEEEEEEDDDVPGIDANVFMNWERLKCSYGTTVFLFLQHLCRWFVSKMTIHLFGRTISVLEKKDRL